MSTGPAQDNREGNGIGGGASRTTGKGRRQFGALLTSVDSPQKTQSSSNISQSISNGQGSSISEPHSSTNGQAHSSKPKKSNRSKPTTNQPKKFGQSTAIKDQSKSQESSGKPKRGPKNVSTKIQPQDDKTNDNHQGQASLSKDENNAGENEEDDVGEVCVICAEPITYYALGVCSHQTCHICSLRMRALYKKRDCALCKTELPEVVFTTQAGAVLSDFDLPEFRYKDSHLSIYCETFEQLEDLLSHLKFNCPHPDCDAILANWKDLKHHTLAIHDLVMCDLCCSNKRVFAHEHTLFTTKALTFHKNHGSVGIGKGITGSRGIRPEKSVKVDFDDGFKGHPKCEFCNYYFYDDDQLYKHCKEKHEQCFICVRNDTGRWQYYTDYQHLESHFRMDHYPCNQTQCLEAKFVAYETALELQAHQIEVHGAELGVKAVKDARKLETNFVYAGSSDQQPTASHQDRRPPRQHSRNTVNVMDIRPREDRTSSQNSSSNRVVPGLQNLNRRKPDRDKLISTLTPDSPHSNGESSANPGASTNDPMTSQKHAALLEQVSEAVGGVERKITAFKAAVKTYRNNEMAAPDFLDNVCHILDHRPASINLILGRLVDILDIDSDRRKDLLERWCDLKLEQTQFPSLDGQETSSFPSLVANYSNLNLNARDHQGSSNWARGQSSSRSSSQTNYPSLATAAATSANRNINSKKNQNVPGLGNWKPGMPNKHSTAWSSSGSTGKQAPKAPPVVTVTNYQVASTSNPHNVSILSNQQVSSSSGSNIQTNQFPSLPSRPKSTGNVDHKIISIKSATSNKSRNINNSNSRGGKTGTNTIIDDFNGSPSSPNNNDGGNNLWNLRNQSQPTEISNNQANSSNNGGKKPKKTILFTNSR